MRLRLFILPLLALAAVIMAMPSAADAKTRYKLGFGDQNPQMFSDPNFTSLKIKRVRLIVPWDFRREAYQLPVTKAWIDAATARKSEIMVAFTARRDCYNNGRYSKRKACRAPSGTKFQKAFRDFRKQFPQVKIYQPWNEINSASQPTFKSPKTAAKYYNIVKKNCKKCSVVGGDFLDSSSVVSYAKKYKRAIKGKTPKIWGLHNYSDVNRSRNKGKITKSLMRFLPGQIYATETGGLVRFGKNFKHSTKRANKQTKYMFKLFNDLSKKRGGYKSRVTRVYPYTFYGAGKRDRFDAGLVGPLTKDGQLTTAKPRPAYKTFKKLAKKASK